MKLTLEDKMMLRKEYGKFWRHRDGSVDEKMVDECVKRASAIALFGDRVLVMDKPHVETEFWMAEHTYDYDEVCAAAQAASDDEGYFIERNIRDSRAQYILDAIERGTQAPFLVDRYYDQGDSRLADVAWLNVGEDEPSGRELDEDEVAVLKELCEGEVEKFEKRLRSYLKRYGMKHVRCSVYWADR